MTTDSKTSQELSNILLMNLRTYIIFSVKLINCQLVTTRDELKGYE